MGVTKAPFINFSVNKIFDLAKVPVGLVESGSYLTGISAAELRRYLSNINVIFKFENWRNGRKWLSNPQPWDIFCRTSLSAFRSYSISLHYHEWLDEVCNSIGWYIILSYEWLSGYCIIYVTPAHPNAQLYVITLCLYSGWLSLNSWWHNNLGNLPYY